MKKFKLILLILISLSGSVMAQSSERILLSDSVVNLSLKQLSRWDMISAAKKLMEENRKLDPIIAEAIVYAVSDRTTNAMVAEVYRDFTDEQIKEVMCFMNTEAYSRISSSSIYESLSLLLTSEITKYMTSDALWKSNIVASNNKTFNALMDKFYKLPNNKELFEEIAQPLIDRLKTDSEDMEKLSEMKKVLQKNFPNYLKVILVEHISQEQLQEVVDFFSQPYMSTILTKAVPPMKPVLDGVMKNPKEFYQKATKELGHLLSVKDTSAIVREYIHLLPHIPVSWENLNDELISFNEKSQNKKNIRKGTSKTLLQKQGQSIEMEEKGYFIDRELHGNGSIEIKRGSTFYQREDGYFAFGNLYGKGKKQGISVSSEGWTCNQTTNGYFYQGVLSGEMEYKELIEKISNTTSEDAIYTFTRLGIEFACRVPKQSSTSLTIQAKGIVGNDKLNGKAEITLSNGDYYKGVFMNGYFLDGTARITYKDGNVYEGEIMSGRYEGKGKLTRADGSWDEGIFMFGSFFSGTKQDKRGELHKIQPRSL